MTVMALTPIASVPELMPQGNMARKRSRGCDMFLPFPSKGYL